MRLLVWVGLLACLVGTADAKGPKIVAEAHYYNRSADIPLTTLYTPRRAGMYRLYVNFVGPTCPATNGGVGHVVVSVAGAGGKGYSASTRDVLYDAQGPGNAAPGAVVFSAHAGGQPITYQGYLISGCEDYVFTQLDLVLEQIAEFPREPSTGVTTTTTSTTTTSTLVVVTTEGSLPNNARPLVATVKAGGTVRWVLTSPAYCPAFADPLPCFPSLPASGYVERVFPVVGSFPYGATSCLGGCSMGTVNVVP